jgi:hypothetical protein
MPDEVRLFQLHLIESSASISYRNRTGIRFLFRVSRRPKSCTSPDSCIAATPGIFNRGNLDAPALHPVPLRSASTEKSRAVCDNTAGSKEKRTAGGCGTAQSLKISASRT